MESTNTGLTTLVVAVVALNKVCSCCSVFVFPYKCNFLENRFKLRRELVNDPNPYDDADVI